MNYLTGRVIGNYRVISRVGEGGMGKVYRAIDLMVEREVALKALKPEIANQAGVMERFRSEAVLLAKLNHPAIAQLYTFVKDGAEFYMVMEYVAGETLENLIHREGAIPWPAALGYAVQILEGVGHAHGLGILHRDLKPANIMLTPGGKAKITDFGIARALGGARMTREGRVIGTLEYLAPERIQGKPADVRSDLYSMGAVLYEMLAGRLPFQAASEYELLMAHVQQTPTAPRGAKTDLPPAVQAAVMRALAKDPDARYPDATAFAAELRGLLAAAVKETRVAEAQPTLPTQVHHVVPNPAGHRPKTKAALAVVAGFLMVAALTFAFVKMFRHESTRVAVSAVAQPPAISVPASQPKLLPAPPVTIPPQPIDVPVPPPAAMTPKPAHRERQPKADNPPAPAVLTADQRRAAIAALEETDGPAAGEPGVRPIHVSGLIAALKGGGAPVVPEVNDQVVARGVNFLLTPGNEEALRQVGATDQTLRIVAAHYRASEPAPGAPAPAPRSEAVALPSPPKSVPAAAHRVSSMADIHVLYVDAPEELDAYLKKELQAQLGGRFDLAASPDGADAIMRVTLGSPSGGMGSKAGRILGIKETVEVRAMIVAPGSARPLWRQTVGDHKLIVGAFRHDSASRLAAKIVKELKEAMLGNAK